MTFTLRITWHYSFFAVMSNIPSSMIDDQFGLAAMLPILNFVKKRGGRNNVPDASDDTLGSEERQRKMFNDNVINLSILYIRGFRKV